LHGARVPPGGEARARLRDGAPPLAEILAQELNEDDGVDQKDDANHEGSPAEIQHRYLLLGDFFERPA